MFERRPQNSSVMLMPEEYLKFEVDQILNLQQKLQGSERFLEVIGDVFSPTNALFVIGPLLTALTGDSLVEIMVAMTLSDYASLLIKWVGRDNRPFWWVRESLLYNNNGRPKLRQHRLTCETTAGGPSSYATIVTVIAFYQGRWLINCMERRTSFNRNVINCVVFTGVSCVILLTWISQSYFGAHFPHQCVSGTILALSVISVLERDAVRKELQRSNRKQAIAFVLGLAMIVGSVCFGMTKMGIDPMWSVRMAFKWCESIDYLKPETTPVYSMVKNLGSAFGIALCAPMEKRMSRSVNRWKSIPITVGFIILDSVILAQTPKDKGNIQFLSATFMTSLLHAYAMIELVPKITNWWDSSISLTRSSRMMNTSTAEALRTQKILPDRAIRKVNIKTSESNR